MQPFLSHGLSGGQNEWPHGLWSIRLRPMTFLEIARNHQCPSPLLPLCSGQSFSSQRVPKHFASWYLVQAVHKPLTLSTMGSHAQHLCGGMQQLFLQPHQSRGSLPGPGSHEEEYHVQLRGQGGISGGRIHWAQLGRWPGHLVSTLPFSPQKAWVLVTTNSPTLSSIYCPQTSDKVLLRLILNLNNMRE